LIGVGLTLDSGLATDDSLSGFVMGHVGSLPDSYTTIGGSVKKLKDLKADLKAG